MHSIVNNKTVCMYRTSQYLVHSVQSIAESSRRPGLRSADPTPLTTSDVALELNLVNGASVMLVQPPGIPYLTVLGLPLMLALLDIL